MSGILLFMREAQRSLNIRAQNALGSLLMDKWIIISAKSLNIMQEKYLLSKMEDLAQIVSDECKIIPTQT